jgi:HPt (histidine-containing phosphotransfer) domain-containing protein
MRPGTAGSVGHVASVLDPEIVDQLRALAQAGNPGLLDRLQASFARDTPERLRALRAAVASGDADAVAFNVHAIKGNAANLGAIEIVATCRQIESSAAAPGARALEPLLVELERHAADAQAELSRMAGGA